MCRAESRGFVARRSHGVAVLLTLGAEAATNNHLDPERVAVRERRVLDAHATPDDRRSFVLKVSVRSEGVFGPDAGARHSARLGGLGLDALVDVEHLFGLGLHAQLERVADLRALADRRERVTGGVCTLYALRPTACGAMFASRVGSADAATDRRRAGAAWASWPGRARGCAPRSAR